MSDTASQFVGSIPEHYDRGLGPWIFRDAALDLARRVAALAPDAVLETAAGTGIASRALRDALSDATRLVVSDLNSPMLEIARAKFDPDEAVELVQADAMGLPYPAESFDLVACQFGVMFFPDKIVAFREAARVLRPGGHLVLSSWAPMAENAFASVVDTEVARVFPGDPPGFYKVPFSYGDPDLALSELSQAGLSARHEALAMRRPVTDPDGFARGLVFGNPVIAEIEARHINPETVVRAVRAALEARLGQPMTLELNAHVFTARKPEAAP